MIVTTKSGTKYKIDLEAKTWERLSKTERSGELRSSSGEFLHVEPIEIGKGLMMFCPPFKGNLSNRLIYTSDVVSVEEE